MQFNFETISIGPFLKPLKSAVFHTLLPYDLMDMEYGYGQDFGSAEPEMDQDAYMREAAIDEDMDD